MTLLDQLVSVNISLSAKLPTIQGFGTPMLLVYHTKYSDLLRAYSDPAGLITDGFTVNDPVYKMASKMFAQNPHPPSFYVGRRQLPFTQIVELTLCNTGSNGYPYSLTITDDIGGVYAVTGLTSSGVPASDATSLFTALTAAPATYDHASTHAWTSSGGNPFIRNGQAVEMGSTGTPPSGYAPATVYYMINVTATTFQLSATKGGSVVVATVDNGTSPTIATVIDGCTITNPSGGVLHFAMTAGKMIDFTGLPVPAKSGPLGTITVQTKTADPGIVSDIVAIEAIDNVSWYGVGIDSNSKAEIEALAAHIEGQTKIFCATSADSDITDVAASTDLFSQMKNLGYTRTHLLYLANETESYADVALMGNRLTTQPGASTWAYASIPGISADANLGGIVNTIVSINGAQAKNGNVYVMIAGLGNTLLGITPANVFIDVPIFLDWLKVNMQARIFIRLANATAAGSKVPYTDDGAAQIGQDVQAQLAAGSDPAGPNPGITPGSTSVTLPKVATMSPINKGNRLYGPIGFKAQLSGALNQLLINGVVTN